MKDKDQNQQGSNLEVLCEFENFFIEMKQELKAKQLQAEKRYNFDFEKEQSYNNNQLKY